MAGKRPDQYNIAPGEAGATDYKNLPQVGMGDSSLDDTVELDRQKLAQSKKQAQGVPVPGSRPAPSVHTKSGTKQADADDALIDQPGAADTNTDVGNPAV